MGDRLCVYYCFFFCKGWYKGKELGGRLRRGGEGIVVVVNRDVILCGCGGFWEDLILIWCDDFVLGISSSR